MTTFTITAIPLADVVHVNQTSTSSESAEENIASTQDEEGMGAGFSSERGASNTINATTQSNAVVVYNVTSSATEVGENWYIDGFDQEWSNYTSEASFSAEDNYTLSWNGAKTVESWTDPTTSFEATTTWPTSTAVSAMTSGEATQSTTATFGTITGKTTSVSTLNGSETTSVVSVYTTTTTATSQIRFNQTETTTEMQSTLVESTYGVYWATTQEGYLVTLSGSTPANSNLTSVRFIEYPTDNTESVFTSSLLNEYPWTTYQLETGTSFTGLTGTRSQATVVRLMDGETMWVPTQIGVAIADQYCRSYIGPTQFTLSQPTSSRVGAIYDGEYGVAQTEEVVTRTALVTATFEDTWLTVVGTGVETTTIQNITTSTTLSEFSFTNNDCTGPTETLRVWTTSTTPATVKGTQIASVVYSFKTLSLLKNVQGTDGIAWTEQRPIFASYAQSNNGIKSVTEYESGKVPLSNLATFGTSVIANGIAHSKSSYFDQYQYYALVTNFGLGGLQRVLRPTVFTGVNNSVSASVTFSQDGLRIFEVDETGGTTSTSGQWLVQGSVNTSQYFDFQSGGYAGKTPRNEYWRQTIMPGFSNTYSSTGAVGRTTQFSASPAVLTAFVKSHEVPAIAVTPISGNVFLV